MTPADDQGPGEPREGLGELMERGVTGLLGVEVVEAGPARVVLRLAVDARLHQPFGQLHGGVSALLAETAASFGGALAAAPGTTVVGIELNASHLRPMREGLLVATATPVRIGRSTHVWDIALADGEGRPVCRARCTLAVVQATSGSTLGSNAGPPF